ncbi:uncharacterized protein PG986_005672 [Apiospora aurea]|uniref:Extracellular serine-rich protein n=1 Tax=Apiospora aurea TaxID=335848 RepID=A0ABR1QI77_9PEZI
MAYTTFFLFLATLVVVSPGARIRVDVGSNGAPALIYTPKVVTAQIGDIVDVHFVDENAASSVVRGDLKTDVCTFPQWLRAAQSNIFSVKINETTPIPIYCSVGGHCRSGMVGYINPGQGDFEAYASAAAKLSQNQPPPMVPQTGGVFQQGVEGGSIMITFINGKSSLDKRHPERASLGIVANENFSSGPPGSGGNGGGGGGSTGGSDPLSSAADSLLGGSGGGSKGKSPK